MLLLLFLPPLPLPLLEEEGILLLTLLALAPVANTVAVLQELLLLSVLRNLLEMFTLPHTRIWSSSTI